MEYINENTMTVNVPKNIGDILIDTGKLTPADVEQITAFQSQKGILFGEAAVNLGLLKEDDVKWALAMQFSYPYLREGENTIAKEVVAVHQPFSSQVESFRFIRSGLMLAGVGGIIKVIAVISPNEGEGKTFTASNLAAVFAQLGSKTILVDFNLRKPRLNEIFNIKNNCGFSSVIVKRTAFEQAIIFTPIPSLHILPSGPKPPNPVELLGWQETRELTSFVRDMYDIVIIDTPSFLETADALKISSLTDGIIMVALKGYTTHNSFGAVKKKLDNAGVRIIGSLINEINGKRREP